MKRFRLTSPKAPKLSENDVERACLDLLAYRQWYVIRLQSGLFKTKDDRYVRVGRKGLPDYVALHRRYPGFLLETKRPGGELSPDQVKVIWEFREGYRIAVATIDRVEDLIPWLDEHEKKNEGEGS